MRPWRDGWPRRRRGSGESSGGSYAPYFSYADWSMRFLAVGLVAACAWAQETPPMEWIDKDTGHRVVRLSRDPGTASLYFHQNAYSADGKKLVVTNPRGIATINLETRAIDQVVEGRVNILVTGRKTGDIYYTRD